MVGAIAVLSILLIGAIAIIYHLVDTLHRIDNQMTQDDIYWNWTSEDLVIENERLERENAELKTRLAIKENAFQDVLEDIG